MIGNKFGKLLVISQSGKNKRGDILWLCKCDCGLEKIVKGSNLRIGKTKSCGCLKKGPNIKNRKNQILNDFELLEFVCMDKNRISMWLAKCKCGSEKIIRSNTSVKSCGCRKKIVDKSRKGKNHPRYNSMLSEKDRNDKRIFSGYHDWKFKVKEKYKFQCLVCGDDKGGNLVSHHLDSYHDNISSRIDINNGVCLCEKCHTSFHKEFGYGKNNKDQFFVFLKNNCIFVVNNNHHESLESFKRENINFYTPNS